MRLTHTLPLVLLSSLLCVSCRPTGDPASEAAAQAELKDTAERINGDLVRIRQQVEELAESTVLLYQPEAIAKNLEHADPSRYAVHRNGVLYKPKDDGNSAVFVSGCVPVDDALKRIVYFTEPLDTAFKQVTARFPEVVQVYYNDRNSYNRIYPFFDVISQYEARMDIPSYNFYYLADASHNHGRGGVWVDEPYVDPAGRGWMVSAIAPVYVDGRLEGVPGIDVTINAITDRYIKKSRAAGLAIVAANGIVVSIHEQLAILFSLPPLENHQYLETIRMDTFRTDDYNLLKCRTPAVREMAERILNGKERRAVLIKDGESFEVLAEPIADVNWTLIKVLD